MSNLDYDQDRQSESVIEWARANGLRPNWILADDVFVEGDVIRFREIIPAPGTEDRDFPEAISDPTPEDEFAVKVGEWQTTPIVMAPGAFGIRLAEDNG